MYIEVLTPKEAATYLRISIKTLKRKLKRLEIRAAYLSLGTIRILKSELDRYLDSRKKDNGK